MLEAKRKRLILREEQESMDADPVLRAQHPSSPTLTLSEGMNCSSQSPYPTKRACAGNARILKEADHIPGNTSLFKG